MTKTFTFGKTSNKNFGKGIFLNGNNNADYSKILDDIIIADIAKKNSYLFDYNDYLDNLLLTAKPTKENDKLTAATNFLANYKSYSKSYKIPFALNKMYTLSDGTPIIFYDDEIQIGFDTYKYSNFSNLSFLNGLSADTKKIIINIYTTGATNININLI